MTARRSTVFPLTLLCLAAASRPVAAQTGEGLAFRPVVLASIQRFAAQQTFDAAFNQASETLLGGGLNVTQDDTWYLELTASRFKKTGQQAFYNNGSIYRLGIPMTATITPFEVTAGYRFHRNPHKLPPLNRRPIEPSPFIPYIGGGFGSYAYAQTSGFATAADNVDTRHAGAVLEGGVEVRVHRWVGVAVDVHYSYVPGILGEGGISKAAGESDLGGIAARFKLVVGR